MDYHVSVSTNKTVDEAVQSIKEQLQTVKFGVLWELDLPAKLQEKGVDYETPYRVLEVCNPHEAKRVLTQNPMIGYFLPCKIVVYEGEDKKTHIGLPKPTALVQVIGDPSLVDIAREIESVLVDAIQRAV